MSRPISLRSQVDNSDDIKSVRIHEPAQFLNINTAFYSVNDPSQAGIKISFYGNIGIMIELKGIKKVFPFSNIRHFDI